MKDFIYKKYMSGKLMDVDDKNIAQQFFHNNRSIKCHLMGKEFSNQLMNVKTNILSSYFLNLKNNLYIEFAENIKFKDTYISGCIYQPKIDGFDMGVVSGLCLFTTQHDSVGTFNLYFRNFLNCTIDEMLKNSMPVDFQDNPMLSSLEDLTAFDLVDIVRYSINCILYVESGTPDLRTIHPPKNKTKSKKGLKKFNKEFPLDIPIVYVGFNYKKHNIYIVDGCCVSGHYRWQPHGEKRSLVKLIWIDEYEKHFNKIVDNTKMVV